jgi:hypothetical protein
MLLLTPSVSGLFKWRQFEPEASCWRLAGTCVSYCRTVTWRSFLLSVDFWSTTSPSGGGCSVTSRKWNDVYARESNRPAIVGGWTLNYIRSWASGLLVSCGEFFRRDPSIFSILPSRTRLQQSASCPKRWGGSTIPCRVSSTPSQRVPACDRAAQS